MIDKSIINERVARIRKLLLKLKQIRDMDEKEFENDFDKQLIAERSLQIIAQAILDIGNHIIAHHGWGKPESYRQIISLLYQNKALSDNYQKELEGLASLRNILVHDYISLKPDILYKDISNGIAAIEFFIKEIMKNYGSNNYNEK